MINASNSNLIIQKGTFNTTRGSSLSYNAYNGTEYKLIINGGKFTADYIPVFVSAENANIEITGGEFIGGSAAIAFSGYKNLSISGGTYKCTDIKNGYGAFLIYDELTETEIAKIIKTGYKLSDGKLEPLSKVSSYDSGDYEEKYTGIKLNEVSVISENKIDNNKDKENETINNENSVNKEDNSVSNTQEETIKELTTNNSDKESVKTTISFEKPFPNGVSLSVKKKEISVKIKKSEKNIKKIYDITLLNANAEIIPISDNKMSIIINLDSDLKGYNAYEVVYIKDSKIEERIKATVTNNKLTFVTNHLSEYGIVAYNVKKNPQTIDNISYYVSFGIISLIGLLCTSLYLNKKID